LPTQIDLLAELQLVDQRLREKTRTVEGGQSRVAELEEALRVKTAAAATAKQELAALETRQRDLEERLAAIKTKRKDRHMRITRIRNDKELGLAKRELDLLKEEEGTVETELIDVLEKVEAATAARTTVDEEVAGLEATMKTEAEELRATIGQLGGEIEQDQRRRESLVTTVDDDLRRRYEMIFARRGGLAVVEIRSGTCQGCHMNVPPQLFNLIQRNEQVIPCPNCQRILHWRPERAEQANG
jgi:predicted  nucleic acid-binding Zn-ribbon protein